jgi:formate dehydrogenase major subunit
MNADDMKLLNLNDNDPVLIRSREGSIETFVKADPALAKGLVFAPYCLSALPSNKLTSPAMDPSSRTAEMKFSAVSVERSSGPMKITS